MTFNDDARAWLGHATGIAPRDLAITALQGSTSSSVFRVEDARGAIQQRFVLRVLDNADWLAEESDLAAHEIAALEAAQAAGLRAPRPIAYAADDVGFGAPVVLMSLIAGAIELLPADPDQWLGGLAGELAAIHRQRADGFPWHFASWVDLAALAIPAWTTAPQAWQRAIALIRQGAPASPAVFIHRDYHPTNVLWQAGAVSGVVDWINACRGPAGVDVGHCRTNLVQISGPEAADRFLEHYRAAAEGFDYDPYWDIDSVLDMCLPRPQFYPPWQEFGLARIAQDVIERRVDSYLERLVALL